MSYFISQNTWIVTPLTFCPKKMLNWKLNETWFYFIQLPSRTSQCVVTAVTVSSSFVELFALNARIAFTLLLKVAVSHSVLITKISQVKGLIKYTWAFSFCQRTAKYHFLHICLRTRVFQFQKECILF